MLYDRDHVTKAVNAGSDAIKDALDLGDRDTDLINLVVTPLTCTARTSWLCCALKWAALEGPPLIPAILDAADKLGFGPVMRAVKEELDLMDIADDLLAETQARDPASADHLPLAASQSRLPSAVLSPVVASAEQATGPTLAETLAALCCTGAVGLPH